jgi:hypothetical protein
MLTTLLPVFSPSANADAVPPVAPSSTSPVSTAQERWDKAVGANRLAQDAAPAVYEFVDPDPCLPDVLLVGDSISIGYTSEVRKLLAGKANVFRIPENGSWSSYILQHLDKWFDAVGKQHFKVIVFNSGLHDVTRLVNGVYDVKGSDNRIPLPDYKANIERIANRLHDHADTLLWASTTVIPDGANGRRTGDEILYNQAAAEVMTSRKIPIIDLYPISNTDRAIYGNLHDVHYKPAGYQRQGTEVAMQISLYLK